ncbi:Siroheme synthase [Pseudovibrio axinellae]|uniref:precorrin-2 dehydrogenase n=1 Tax=Pseudovibrio axinellae TaxID=989403 RepID=A0A166BDK8_9HYPH|nr:NAD(P)-dependent oxidoreductase [Pseudovibrio axinellae]KZL22157.1 Siroheme synthase [Pseudovibrio axinellae]SEQ53067.1 uroporphyrin-III C-methyltransferase / precorrin-2 dehydrogenase / sirohydrochlorin ferrochelatase [Pseudovibrio axinellae]
MVSSSKRHNKPARISRIEKLSVLPVFFNLQGKQVLIIGGSNGAYWKSELLAAAGANLQVIAPADHIAEDFRQYLEVADKNHVMWEDRNWESEDLKGKSLAVADLEELQEIERFKQAAKQHACPSNLIDKPEYCDFQFGSIVSRGPCVVGISTSGVAPVLGQSIRLRIQALLPQWLEQWGELAQRIRPQVMRRFVSGVDRRRFWQKFSEKAWDSAPSQSTIHGIYGQLKEEGQGEQENQNNLLYFRKKTRSEVSEGASVVEVSQLGADYLTLRDLRLLQSASRIVSAPDVPEAVLRLARREALHQTLENDQRVKAGDEKGCVLVRMKSDSLQQNSVG